MENARTTEKKQNDGGLLPWRRGSRTRSLNSNNVIQARSFKKRVQEFQKESEGLKIEW